MLVQLTRGYSASILDQTLWESFIAAGNSYLGAFKATAEELKEHNIELMSGALFAQTVNAHDTVFVLVTSTEATGRTMTGLVDAARSFLSNGGLTAETLQERQFTQILRGLDDGARETIRRLQKLHEEKRCLVKGSVDCSSETKFIWIDSSSLDADMRPATSAVWLYEKQRLVNTDLKYPASNDARLVRLEEDTWGWDLIDGEIPTGKHCVSSSSCQSS
ncbi:Hypothetical Protein FCC1311_118122, partial [Hondaea fermentalgiana]